LRTLRDYAYSTIKPLIEWGISVFNPGDTVSKVLGELIEAGRYEAIVVSGRKMGVVTLRDFLDSALEEEAGGYVEDHRRRPRR